MASRAQVENFLYYETSLLDTGAYAAWIDLFTDDGRYWVPAEHSNDANAGVSLVFDDKPRMRERLIRQSSGQFWAQQPASQVTRLVGNVRVLTPFDNGDEQVEARLLICEFRGERQQLLSGVCHYRLNCRGETFLIREKKVLLNNRARYFANLGFLP